MKNQNLLVGIFTTAAVALFGAGLFFIGNQYRAFTHHVIFYTNFQNVDGLTKGAQVKVDGLKAGEVQSIQIPSSPAQKFRLKMNIDDRLHGLIREDSLVTVETEGIVGDKFLVIHVGGEHESEAPAGSTLQSKEPLEMSKLLEQAQGIMKQASTTIDEVQVTMNNVRGHLDTTLDTATSTIKNVNGVVRDVRGGKGVVGMLLEDKATAGEVRQSLANVRQTTEKLNGSSTRIDNILADVQARQLVGKMDATLSNARSATQNLNKTSQQIDTTLQGAFAQDQYGEDAGANLQQSLTNINQATGNLADDTEALKHEFFFKHFFKHRGYDDLDDLPVEQYRAGQIFKDLPESRQWIPASSLFITNEDGEEVLSAQGRHNIDLAVGQFKEIYGQPLIIEGYASSGSGSDELIQSRRRASQVRTYLQLHFHLLPKNTAIVALRSTPPKNAGKSTFDGVSLVCISDSNQ
ncbi:MAG TPA: MlaD family protein [Candidatus Deferrimicrobiaceae bacterium]|nr:MlaD family protein [Candidatus Deferrimicrobiaceae bacterium]